MISFRTAFGRPAPLGGGGFGTFGQPSGLSTLGQQQQMLGQQQAQLNPDEQFAESIYNVSIFGDERDIVIAKWNYLQAMWGNGKAFYAKNLPPVEITPQNVRYFVHILSKSSRNCRKLRINQQQKKNKICSLLVVQTVFMSIQSDWLQQNSRQRQ